jgi:hypothetical protein
VSTAVWDQATWDSTYWDTSYATYTPVIFNLAATEGSALTLEFVQNEVSAPVTIAGYSILYSVAGLRI